MTCGRSGAPQAVPGERHTLGSFLERMVRLLQHPQEAAPFLDPPRGAPLLLPPSTVHQAPTAPPPPLAQASPYRLVLCRHRRNTLSLTVNRC